jgi:hypothetical protein
MAKVIKKKPASRTKSAYADESFYYQLKAGGNRGWNDAYVDPKDETAGKERFYIKYYGAMVGSVELITKNDELQTKITLFGGPDKSPVPSERPVNEDEWGRYFDEVMEAIQTLYQL